MESVWDFPRPPAVAACERPVQVELGATTVADSDRALRVLETSHPPTIYIPMEDVVPGALEPVPGTTFCEFKGRAEYFDVVAGGRRAARAAWHFLDPTPGYEAITGHVSFYPGRMDACRLGGELVRAQAGDFYGGWITADLTGPFKGPPGTRGW